MPDAARKRKSNGTLVFLAVVAVSLLAPWVDPQVRLCLLLLGVTFNTWYGGLRQGMLTAVFSAIVVEGCSLAMKHSYHLDILAGVRLSVFLLSCYLLNKFASSYRDADASRQRNEQWNRRLVETAREGFWVINDRWRTTFVNGRMAELLGYARRELIGQDFREFLVDGGRFEAITELARRDYDLTEQQELRFRRGDGSKLWANVTTNLLTDDAGNLSGLLVVVEDITDRKRAERERDKALKSLQESEARHGRLVESNIIGIMTAEISGDVVEANDAFLRMVGYSRDDLQNGRVRWSEMTPPEYQPLDQNATNELWATGACTPYEKEFLRQDGSRVPVLVGAAAMERYPRTWIGFALDLTERKRVEQALQEAKDAAESASRAKDQFLAMLSHELRTPLTPVLLMATALLDDPDTSDETRPLLEMTRRNVELEARLIDDLLDITRISSGKLQLNREIVDAHALIRQTLDICRDDIRAGGLTVDLELAAESAHVDADPARLQQAFWNLIKNAVKFTPRGGRLTIRSRNEPAHAPASPPTLVVEVCDTGIGIDPAVLPKIFDAFEQGDSSTRRRFGGLGLGLAISRSVVTMHGGSLTAASAGKNAGATFTIGLATVPAPMPESPTMPGAPKKGAPMRPLRILLVEDNKETLRYLSWILMRHHHIVESASTLESALEAAEKASFDLVISDIQLPDGSGLELMQRLGGPGSIPGIALSGFGSDDDIQMSKAAGFMEHLTKPVDFVKLEEAIAQLTTLVEQREGPH